MRISFFLLFALICSCLKQEHYQMPDDFIWCVGVSAHQFEGNNIHSDWWHWESLPGKIKNGERSGIATDHWNRLREDLDLVDDLGVGMFRFTIEWARIEPQEGVIDYEAVAHYRQELAILKSKNIEPMVTLHQLTLPKWFADKGGFSWKGAPEAFGRYADFVAREVASEVRYWTTTVDGLIHLAGYLTEDLPPGLSLDMGEVVRPLEGLVRAHAKAYKALHEVAKERNHQVMVGSVQHVRVYDPAFILNPIEMVVANSIEYMSNWAYLDAIETGIIEVNIPFTLNFKKEIPEIKGTHDFIGINYYTRSLVKFAFDGDIKSTLKNALVTKKNVAVTDMDWEIYPKGMLRILEKTHRKYPRLPIFITENGIADSDDDQRKDFIGSYLYYIHKALEKGIPVKGYCHWALTDNFEWAEGFEPRFGLYGIDYETLERIKRPSVDYFKEIIRTNSFYFSAEK